VERDRVELGSGQCCKRCRQIAGLRDQFEVIAGVKAG